jgi:crotonobetainyl-CoA:carnitine CoA-transferase CaiB-like acyl-CoA transferase
MDEVVQMMGGLAYMTGPPGQPLRAGTSVIDIGGGMFGVMGILTALYQRERTGEGALVRGALFETTAFFMGQHMAYSALTEGPIPPMPARVSAWSVYRIFAASDHPVFVGVISDKHWRAFCDAFERPDWLADPRLETNNSRIDQRDWLLPEIEKLMAGLTRAQVIERCERVGIPVAPIATPEDLFDDPHLRCSDGLVETELLPGQRAAMPRIPVQMDGHDFGLRLDPPVIGEHTDEILRLLGYTDDAIDALARDGIVVSGER